VIDNKKIVLSVLTSAFIDRDPSAVASGAFDGKLCATESTV
jgi:hypothetical protein